MRFFFAGIFKREWTGKRRGEKCVPDLCKILGSILWLSLDCLPIRDKSFLERLRKLGSLLKRKGVESLLVLTKLFVMGEVLVMKLLTFLC